MGGLPRILLAVFALVAVSGPADSQPDRHSEKGYPVRSSAFSTPGVRRHTSSGVDRVIPVTPGTRIHSAPGRTTSGKKNGDGAHMGKGSGMGTGRGMEMGTGKGIDMGTGRGMEMGTGKGMEMGTGTGVPTGTGAGFGETGSEDDRRHEKGKPKGKATGNRN